MSNPISQNEQKLVNTITSKLNRLAQASYEVMVQQTGVQPGKLTVEWIDPESSDARLEWTFTPGVNQDVREDTLMMVELVTTVVGVVFAQDPYGWAKAATADV